jgi:nicotinamidase-related amidase
MTSKMNPECTALIVVDMQNDFAHKDGALYAPPSGQAIEPIYELLVEAENHNLDIIYTQDIHTEEQFEDANYYDEYERWGKHVQEGTWGAEIIEDLEPDRFADKIVQKHTYNAFHKTELDGWLEAHGINNLLICGTLANVCVLHTASGAGLRDYRPILVKDCLGYLDESDKSYAIEHTDWLFGDTITTNEIDWD